MSRPERSCLHDPRRRDLTRLPVMTIDGQATLDYDDALSIERSGGQVRLGVHISDVGHMVRKGSRIDQTGAERGSSIYTPDQRIPMMPDVLAEGQCSLKADCLRPAVSLMVTLDAGTVRISHWEIFPSVIRVRDQLSYYDVNLMADDNPDIRELCAIADAFRKYRLDSGAVQITLPEVHVWVGDAGQINVNRVNRESPGRRLVAEIMILANWLMARFLAQKGLAAVFRSQPDPRERLYSRDEGTLYQNHMQRRLLNRFVLGSRPEAHSGLGLDAYVTATSPIRKFSDLVTQRQIRAGLGLEAPYSAEEVDQIIQGLAAAHAPGLHRPAHPQPLLAAQTPGTPDRLQTGSHRSGQAQKQLPGPAARVHAGMRPAAVRRGGTQARRRDPGDPAAGQCQAGCPVGVHGVRPTVYQSS